MFTIPGEDLAKNQVSYKNIIAAKFLSGKENPKAYGKDWEKLVIELRRAVRDPAIKDAIPDIEHSVLFSDLSLDVRSQEATMIYDQSRMVPPVMVAKQDKPEKFILPNKPMYRIFEIDDLEEINGFTGYYIIQEKYDGVRIQVHKFDDKVSIYTNRGRDITDKMGDCVKFFEDKDFKDLILDGEAVLYQDDDPLVRSDTIGFLNKKVSEGGDIRLHIFDVMHYDGEEVYKEKLEDRMVVLMNNFAAKANEKVEFPNKKNTREADSLEELDRYAKEIMDNPASEGVVIKDAKSSYVVGKKKNPKWVKWKKFVDLDVIILDARENKNKTYSYLMGVGPVEGGPKSKEVNGETYMSVGRAGNYSDKLEVGSIIRVKVDDIVGTKEKGFTLNGAKVHEIPEVEYPDKVVTLELLTEGGRKSLGDYQVEALKKSYYLTDNIHGIVKMDLELDTEGLLLHGFKGNNLMGKNAWADKDMWMKQIRLAYDKDNGKFFVMCQQIMDGHAPMTIERLHKICMEQDPDIIARLFSGKNPVKQMKQRLMKGGEAYGIEYSNGKFSYDDDTLAKSKARKGMYTMWLTDEGFLHFVIEYQGKEYVWEIEVGDEEEIYDFFGESGKYPCSIIDSASKDELFDKGQLVIGAQRHGYHEYILSGEEVKSKLHFRYVEAFDDQKMWIAFTGYKQEPAPKDSDEGLVNIYEDKFANDMEIKKKRSSSIRSAKGLLQLISYYLLNKQDYFTSEDIMMTVKNNTYDQFLDLMQDANLLTYKIKETPSTGATYRVKILAPHFENKRISSRLYQILKRNLEIRSISGVMEKGIRTGQFKDIEGNTLIIIKGYVVTRKFDSAADFEGRSVNPINAITTQEFFDSERNSLMQGLEKNYKKIYEKLAALNSDSSMYRSIVNSYAKFDIDLLGTIYRLLQQESK